MADVLFLIGSGAAPRLTSQKFLMPTFVGTRSLLVSLSFPVIEPMRPGAPPAQIDVGGRMLRATPLTSVDLMARRRLHDDMPAIMLRAAIRSTTSATLQYQAQRASSEREAPLALAAAILGAGTAILDTADDRTWRALPSEVSIVRARLPRGTHRVTIHAPQGPRSAEFGVSGRYAVVDLRLLRNQLFVNAAQGVEGRPR
jgi:hypothetical protein